MRVKSRRSFKKTFSLDTALDNTKAQICCFRRRNILGFSNA